MNRKPAAGGFILMPRRQRDRRRLLVRGAATVVGAAALTGCDRLSQDPRALSVLRQGERWSEAAHRVIAPASALAQEFGPEHIAPVFRGNGTLSPRDADYVALRDGGFADWRLAVGGLVEQPLGLSLAELRALPSRTQITRHDCVEGWSCIGQWTGVQLSRVLALARPKPEARFVLFRCFDSMGAIGPAVDTRYYESISLDEAAHVQTVLAYDLNGQPLPVTNGAPLRLRVERQLGYKQAKYLKAIELVASFDEVRGGRGGFWEDEGYEWYAGI